MRSPVAETHQLVSHGSEATCGLRVTTSALLHREANATAGSLLAAGGVNDQQVLSGIQPVDRKIDAIVRSLPLGEFIDCQRNNDVGHDAVTIVHEADGEI